MSTSQISWQNDTKIRKATLLRVIMFSRRLPSWILWWDSHTIGDRGSEQLLSEYVGLLCRVICLKVQLMPCKHSVGNLLAGHFHSKRRMSRWCNFNHGEMKKTWMMPKILSTLTSKECGIYMPTPEQNLFLSCQHFSQICAVISHCSNQSFNIRAL